MKLTKLISAVSAIAMSLSMVTVANAASLGGKPSVTASFAGYEIDYEYDNQIVAKIDFTLDVSAAEELSAYSSSGKGSAKVEKGNGITTLGISWDYGSDFEYWDDTVGDTVLTLNGNGNAVAFGPKTSASEYLVDEVVTFSVRYAVYDNDVAGSIAITDATVDGKSTTDKAVWAYAKSAANIDVVGCDIPSYNEWSNPVVEEEKTVWTSADDASIPADKQIIADVANVTGITKDTRVTVSNGSEEKTFGNNIFAYLNEKCGFELADDATVDAEIRFAILAPIDADADAFTFEVK